MKLGEKRAKRGGRVRSIDALPKRLEDEVDFDPKIHLTEEDWAALANEVKTRWETKERIHKCVKLLMAAQYLDPGRYHALINSPELKTTFSDMASPKFEEHFNQHPHRAVVDILTYRLAIRDVFPHHEAGKEQEPEKKFLRNNSNYTRNSVVSGYLTAMEMMVIMKRLHMPEIDRPEAQIPDAEFEQFKEKWEATWVTGHLEDVVPDKLVRGLAMIRVVNPKLFQRIPLDKKFWALAKEWVNELRDSIDRGNVIELFQFAFDLSILAAEEVSVLPDGKLDIRPKKVNIQQPVPLPTRETV